MTIPSVSLRRQAACRASLTKVGRGFLILVVLAMLLGTGTRRAQAVVINFTGAELLGQPTGTSVTINVIPDANIELYYEYGTAPGVYTAQTATGNATGGQPHETVLSGLQPGTRYYYRMQYRTPGDAWVARGEHSFWTQRPPGSTFTFTITSDSHVNILLGSATTWQQTMTNVAGNQPDFHLDLGDTFAMDNVTTVGGAETAYLYQRQFFDLVGGSAPIFLALGNHEQEEAWHLDDTGNPATSKPVMGANARKKYYPNPIPGAFYSGNSDPYSYLDGDQLREDYFAWTWGDALFVVIDPYWYTTTKPFVGNTGGGESSDAGSGDRWDWTLGLQQFNWLKQTLENSTASYKFVFAHHMTGGSDDYVRGGAVPAHLVEWGGYDENGTTWGWDARRPGWGTQPVHQILVANNVSAFFHGHDHQYAYEMRDGVVYQSMPAAGFSGNGFNIYSESNPLTIKVLPSPGSLRVTVSPAETTVDYIQTTGGTVAYSYDILPATPPAQYDLTIAVDPPGSGTTIPAAGIHTYAAGTLVPITATAAAGYDFSHWSGACAGSGPCQVTMDGDKSVTAVFQVEPNTAPVAAGDSYQTNEDTALTVAAAQGLLANDSDADGDPLTALKVSDPAHGALTLNTDGSFSYTPGANFAGSDSFTYKANDGLADSNTATVSITVNPVNDPPAITEGASVLVNMSEDGSPTAFALTLNATDPDPADTLTWSIHTQPAHGSASASGTGASKAIGYTPAADYNGSDSFVVQVSDGALSDTITVNVSIAPVNDAPTCADTTLTTPQDTQGQTAPLCSDIDGDTLTFSIVAQPAHGTAAVDAGSLVYTPAALFFGADSFTYKANDGQADSNTAAVDVSVTRTKWRIFLPFISKP